jgi:glucokinase
VAETAERKEDHVSEEMQAGRKAADSVAWAAGVDLGGTKVEVARVERDGRLVTRLRRPTDVKDGQAAVEAEINAAVRELIDQAGSRPVAVGVGVAGQVDGEGGLVRFAPNLEWHDVPLAADLTRSLGLPVVVANDVRAITWGEWLHGAGEGADDLICLMVGTGIGGGVVSGGRMLGGCTNSAGELGHITVDLHGPPCHCGNRGCMEALAGGWAIARRARQAVHDDPAGGASLLRMAGGQQDAITAETVAEAAHVGDPLARRLLDEVGEALVAGAVGLVNAFNPCRLILGGGVIEGLPELVERVDQGVRQRALPSATASLRVMQARLHNDAGVIGAAALAHRTHGKAEAP